MSVVLLDTVQMLVVLLDTVQMLVILLDTAQMLVVLLDTVQIFVVLLDIVKMFVVFRCKDRTIQTKADAQTRPTRVHKYCYEQFVSVREDGEASGHDNSAS
jgi:hypothetical protein